MLSWCLLFSVVSNYPETEMLGSISYKEKDLAVGQQRNLLLRVDKDTAHPLRIRRIAFNIAALEFCTDETYTDPLPAPPLPVSLWDDTNGIVVPFGSFGPGFVLSWTDSYHFKMHDVCFSQHIQTHSPLPVLVRRS